MKKTREILKMPNTVWIKNAILDHNSDHGDLFYRQMVYYLDARVVCRVLW